jgi:glucokinase
LLGEEQRYDECKRAGCAAVAVGRASAEGVLRVATAAPSPRPRLQAVRELDITGVPTFTDGLQRIEREHGVRLHGTRCAIAMAGATSGEALSLVRSRWTITRSGLAAIFEQPVTVLNDVAARAWAVRSGTATVVSVRGMGAPAFDKPGRFLMIMVEEGVGAAIVDVDRTGQMRVLETEAGHMDFGPLTEPEFRLSEVAKGINLASSWERMLMLDRNDPLWVSACPQMLDPERPRLQSELLGRFAVNLVHAYGAWNGVMLTGSRVNRILETGWTKRVRGRVRRPQDLRAADRRLPGVAGRPARSGADGHGRAAGLQPAAAERRRLAPRGRSAAGSGPRSRS